MSKWIDLDDKYPEDNEYVLVWCKGYFEGGISLGEKCECYGIGYVYGNKWTIYNCKNTIFNTVIAWMPLPEPYKKGEC